MSTRPTWQPGYAGCESPPQATMPAHPRRRDTDGPSDTRLLERFVARQDPNAFEALVRRYGAMVLGICRRVLGDEHAAEDAFQSTFLVLARKASSIAKPELLGNWLYGVAYRTASKARILAARRRARELQAVSTPEVNPLDEVISRDLGRAVVAALAELPDKYRAPLVLCYLEGKTNGQAARQLGWPVGSMSGRLARGRELLRRRLS